MELSTSMLKKITKVTFLFFLHMLFAASIAQAADKPVYQETDSSKPNYLSNRRALVGPGCSVNSLFDGVKVIGGVKDLQNLVDEDLSNYASFPSLADVGVAVAPIVSVKDLDNAYAAGTEVGFSLQGNTGAALLKLDVSTFYRIWFYRNGEKVGEAAVKEGQDVKGLELKLIELPGNKDFTKDITATAPAEFDEIKLVKAGVDVAALGTFNVRYAFVGKARTFTLTKSGIEEYNKLTGQNITVKGHGEPGDHLAVNASDLVDDDLENGRAVVVLLKLFSSLPATVTADNGIRNKETFKAGTEVGFVYTNTTGLDLSVANTIKLTLYDTNNKKIDEYWASASVLGLTAGKVEKGTFLIKAPKDFSSAKITFPGVLSITAGEVKVNYAFIRMASEIASHHCPINVVASKSVCDCNNEYQLDWNKDIDVTWSVDKEPQGSHATVDNTGKVTLSVPGEYRFKAQAADGCYEYTTLGYGNVAAYDAAKNGEKILVNVDKSRPLYELTDRRGGGLSISSGVKNSSALLSKDLRNFSYLKASVDLIENKVLAGVKSINGSNLAEGFDGKMKAGFVVATNTTGLTANVLDIFNVHIYNKGEEVKVNATKHWSTIAAGLAGSGQMQKMRYSIELPKGTVFDEIVLQKTGVLSADLSQFNIYYAFVDDAENTTPSEDLLYNATIISHKNTDASIDFKNSDVFSVANIGNGIDNIANVIDGNLKNGVNFPLGANLGGAKLAVNMGCVATPDQQLVVVMDKVKLGLGVELGNALKIITSLKGEKQEELTSWKVLGADIIGDGGESYAMLNPTKEFDQVSIVPVNVLGALTNIKLYGLALRNDANEDGVPDVVDPEPCARELVLDEDYALAEESSMNNVRMVLHRTLAKNVTGDYAWNSIILPVSMTRAQIDQAFGSDTKLAELSKAEDKWIYFKEMARPTNDADVVLNANVPYLIMPSREADLDANAQYESMKNGMVNGPIYFVTGISYEKPATMENSVSSNEAEAIDFCGSYEKSTRVAAGSYMMSKGNLVHTAIDHNIKPYRGWLNVVFGGQQQKQLRLIDVNGTTTDIKNIGEITTKRATGIYTIGGQRMESDNLPNGVYIINGVKVIKK